YVLARDPAGLGPVLALPLLPADGVGGQLLQVFGAEQPRRGSIDLEAEEGDAAGQEAHDLLSVARGLAGTGGTAGGGRRENTLATEGRPSHRDRPAAAAISSRLRARSEAVTSAGAGCAGQDGLAGRTGRTGRRLVGGGPHP